MTGDLGETGEPGEYTLFRDLVAPLKIPLYVIPGNHDGSALWTAFPDLAARRPAEGLGYVAEVGPLRLIMFDSTLPGQHHGAATPERCDWFAAALAEGGDRPALLFLHHPPFVTGIGHMDHGLCNDAAGLTEMVAKSDTLLAIGCGHIHRTITSAIGGTAAIVAPSTAHAVRFDLGDNAPPGFDLEPPGFLLHRIVQTETGWTHVVHTSFIGAYPGPFPFADAGEGLSG